MTCTWPGGTCACYEAKSKADASPDARGRVWMHCESGLSMSKACMGRFMNFCLSNCVELGEVHPVNPRFARCQVLATLRIRPDQFAAFEAETGGKLTKPPRIVLN